MAFSVFTVPHPSPRSLLGHPYYPPKETLDPLTSPPNAPIDLIPGSVIDLDQWHPKQHEELPARASVLSLLRSTHPPAIAWWELGSIHPNWGLPVSK